MIFTPETHLHIGANILHRPEFVDEDFFDGRLAEVRLIGDVLSVEEMEELRMSCEAVSTSSTTAVAPDSENGTYKHRADLHVGYTRSPTPCIAEEWAYSNLTGNCYMFFADKLTQAEAIDVCKSKNGDLLSIQNLDEQKFLDTVLTFDYEDYWTLGRKDASGNFTYGGTEIAWTNWLADDLLTTVPDGTDVCLCVVKNLFTKGFFLMKGKWDTKPCSEKKGFVCQTVARRCPAMPTAEYVEPHPPKPYIELTIDYKCKPGYVLPNYTARYLDWKQHEPTGNATANMTEAWQTSKPNITKMPSMKYECLFSAKWSDGSLAPCEPSSCKVPPDVKHADRNSSERVFPSWIEYTCQHGWHWKFGINTSFKVAWCGPDTEWIDVPPDCEPVECEPFPRVGNATVNSANNRFKETVIWTCNPGWMFPDRNVRHWVGCRENFVNWQIGRWNISKLDDCIPLHCPEPPRPPNTTMDSNDTSWKASILYSCVSEEFEFPNGDEEMVSVCSDEARWKPNVPFCTKKAPKLTLKGKKYAPPPKESPSAQTVGTLAITIMIVMLVVTVLIDLGTCYQGLRFLRYNLRSFQRNR
ncbi:sushi, von Willebrand factor type A, EGF and pentraxin domain-containing protein 1-like [Lineus longissimus]|uniref:sushi, von Willebrand factor type A, EGF and pentraxin domain-containing protein 1-like n=1 Tax=Lineus longissimus TaxID=88925 RepID=UPI002B4DD5FB